MTKAINKKVLSAVLFLAMVLNIFSGLALPASAEDTVAGKWSGSTTAANGTVYSFDLTLEANGDYTLVNTYKLGEDTYKETENGTYAAAGGKIDFTGDKLIVEAMEATYSADKTSGTVSGDTMTVTRHASFMAKSMGKAAVEITFKQTEKAVTYEDNLKAGKYELTEESYDASAFMKLPMLITIDTEKKTFNTQDAREGKDLANKGFGSYTFDEKTGIYTVTYTADTAEGATASFTYSDKGLTFVTPIYFGKASMNITDDNGNFIPYTATPYTEPVKYEDNLKAGKYELTEESYDASAFMKLPMLITIDTEKKTFNTQDAREGKDFANKGFGSYTFDEKTGIYTVTYTADTAEGATTSFTYSDKGLTFVMPIYFGKASMNITDENDNFIPYTAKLAEDKDTESTDDKTEEPEKQPESGAAFKEGKYTGTYNKTAMSGVDINYEISAVFADGKYSYDVKVALSNGEYDGQDATKAGTYTVNGSKLTFDEEGPLESAEITGEGKLKIYGTLSSFAFAPDYADIVWTEDAAPAEADDSTGSKLYKILDGNDQTYQSGSDEDITIRCEGGLQDFTAIRFDGVKMSDDSFSVSEGSTVAVIKATFLKTVSDGTHRVVFEYTDGVSETVKLRVASAEGTYPDDLVSGDYELKLEDFDDIAGVHKHPCIITIDKEAGTFIIHDTDDPETDKGSGTVSFDSATGEYTFTYTAGGPETQEDNTTTFKFADNGLVFTSPLKLGRSMMNVTAEDGSFIPYTAKLITAEDNKGGEDNNADNTNAPADSSTAVEGGSATSNPKTGTMAGGVMLTLSLAGVMALAVSKKKK